MGKLKDKAIYDDAVYQAYVRYSKAEDARSIAAQELKRKKIVKLQAKEALRNEEAKVKKAYNEAVDQAIEKAREHFGNRRFSAMEFDNFLDGDISSHEFASWVCHKTANEEQYPRPFLSSLAIVNNYHLPDGVKTTHPRKVVKKFAELDDNGQPIPGTEFTKEHTECALYWFED